MRNELVLRLTMIRESSEKALFPRHRANGLLGAHPLKKCKKSFADEVLE